MNIFQDLKSWENFDSYSIKLSRQNYSNYVIIFTNYKYKLTVNFRGKLDVLQTFWDGKNINYNFSKANILFLQNKTDEFLIKMNKLKSFI